MLEGEREDYLKADILSAIELAEGQQGDDGQDGHDGGQCGCSAVVAADDLGIDRYRQGLGLAGIQDDGVDSSLIMVTQLRIAPEMMPEAIMGTVMRKNAFDLGSAQRDGSFLNAHGDLLQDSTDERMV